MYLDTTQFETTSKKDEIKVLLQHESIEYEHKQLNYISSKSSQKQK